MKYGERRIALGIFSRLFKKEEPAASQTVVPATEKKVASLDDGYESLPAFIPTSPKEYQLVSVIATAIAAGENSDSQFVVKTILKRNPEARTVALVAASLAAGTAEDSQLVVTSIQKKK
ncbi:hypothetical protein [Enterococcus sp. LJL120]